MLLLFTQVQFLLHNQMTGYLAPPKFQLYFLNIFHHSFYKFELETSNITSINFIGWINQYYIYLLVL